MKIRVKAVFGNPKTNLAAVAIDGIVFGEWMDVKEEEEDDDDDKAVEKFLSEHPECNSWNIAIERDEDEMVRQHAFHPHLRLLQLRTFPTRIQQRLGNVHHPVGVLLAQAHPARKMRPNRATD